MQISLRERFALHDRLMAYVDGLPADHPARADLTTRLTMDAEHLSVLKAMMADDRWIGIQGGGTEDNDNLHMNLIDRKASDDIDQKYRAEVTQALANIFEKVAEHEDPAQFLDAHFAMMMGIANALATMVGAMSPMIAPASTTMFYAIYRAMGANPLTEKLVPALPELMALGMAPQTSKKVIKTIFGKHKIMPDDINE